MDPRKIVFQETAVVAVGEVICTTVMVGIFALMGYFDASVVLGAIVGAVLAVGNFLFMAIGASLAADKAQAQDVKGGQNLIQLSMLLRYGLLFVVLFACGKSGMFNLIALALPLVFVRPTLTVAEFFRRPGEKKL